MFDIERQSSGKIFLDNGTPSSDVDVVVGEIVANATGVALLVLPSLIATFVDERMFVVVIKMLLYKLLLIMFVDLFCCNCSSLLLLLLVLLLF